MASHGRDPRYYGPRRGQGAAPWHRVPHPPAGSGDRRQGSTEHRNPYSLPPLSRLHDARGFRLQLSAFPGSHPKTLKAWAKLRFIEQGENIVLLVPPGVGKTHLVVALGVKAAEAGYRVLFPTATVGALAKARAEHRVEERLTRLHHPTLLIIDGRDSLPFEKRDATCFLKWSTLNGQHSSTFVRYGNGLAKR